MVEFYGWLAGILFALCAVPLALKAWNDGHTKGLSTAFLWIWLAAEVFAIIAECFEPIPRLFRLFNYNFGLTCLLFTMKFTYWPRKYNNVVKLQIRGRK